MAWAADNNGWLQSGTPSAPECWIFTTQMAGSGALVLGLIDAAIPVGARIYGSPLLDTCYEVITTGGTGGNIVIRKVTLGTAGAALQTAAHGLTTAATFTMEVRWVNGLITVYLNGSTTAILSYDTANALGHLTGIGFATSTDLARVGTADLYVLTQTFAALADVAWWVAGGTLYASDSGAGGGRAIGAFFDPNAQVIGAELRQKAYIVDGTSCVQFDAATMTAQLFSLTAGTMPGQTSLNTPLGRTTAKVVLAYSDRLLFLQEQYGIASRIGDETDLDLSAAADDTGKAYAFQAGGTGQVGEPIVGGYVTTKNRLVLWGRRSIYEQTGDPVLGAELTRLSDDIGGTGPNAAALVSEGSLILHSDEGLIVIPAGGNPVFLSRDVLTEHLQTELAADTLLVTLVRDVENHGTWCFFTPTDGTSRGTHIWYDERTGRFSPEGGGFWPMQLASATIEPTCGMRYQGKVVVGTRNGKMLCFDAGAGSADAGTDFEHRMAMNLITDDVGDAGILLYQLDMVMGLGSEEVTVTITGGETAERAYDSSSNTLWTRTLAISREVFYVNVSSGALVMTISGTGTSYALEKTTVEYGLDPMNKVKRNNAVVPAAPCALPTADTTPADPGPDGGPGPGGDDGDTCVACATFMGSNSDAVIDGKDAYTLGSGATIEEALANAQTEYDSFFSGSNVCDIPAFDAAQVVVFMEYTIGPETTITEIGTSQDHIDYPWPSASIGETQIFTVYITCEDNGL